MSFFVFWNVVVSLTLSDSRYVTLTRSLNGGPGDTPAGSPVSTGSTEARRRSSEHSMALRRAPVKKAWMTDVREAPRMSFTDRGRWKH